MGKKIFSILGSMYYDAYMMSIHLLCWTDCKLEVNIAFTIFKKNSMCT